MNQILQVTAGGRLYNVVVDTEDTGKKLLKNGNLRNRVTIIPLNKIQTNVIPDRVQQAARRLVIIFPLISLVYWYPFGL
jgi:structural maintenance of chromosome 2